MKWDTTALVTFLYVTLGNLTSQRDGRNQWLYFEYDALDRLVAKRQDSVNGTLLAEYLFDATGQKGLLSRSKAYTAEGVVEITNVTYDVRGRLTQQNWIVLARAAGHSAWTTPTTRPTSRPRCATPVEQPASRASW